MLFRSRRVCRLLIFQEAPRGSAVGSRGGDVLRDSSVAPHNNGVEYDGDGSMENGPAESGESAVKPAPRSPDWIKRVHAGTIPT